MRCKHCGVGLEYYATVQHSERRSCQVSDSGYHYFVVNTYYFLYTVYHSCFGKAKHASCPVQTSHRPLVPGGHANGSSGCAK